MAEVTRGRAPQDVASPAAPRTVSAPGPGAGGAEPGPARRPCGALGSSKEGVARAEQGEEDEEEEGEPTAPETGSPAGGSASTDAAAGRSGDRSAESGRRERGASVGRDAPDIPNVVEYHLKVKPQQQRPDRRERAEGAGKTCIGAPSTTTTTTTTTTTMLQQQRPSDEQRLSRELTQRLARLSLDDNVFEGSDELPQVFQAKYLGSRDARGLWGVRHTRRPVDGLVAAAKALAPGAILPLVKLVVDEAGVALLPLGGRGATAEEEEEELAEPPPPQGRLHPIESISYGVQDLVYTRVFSMIVVRESEDFRRLSPFECHGFVCESKRHARQMTCALAAAFRAYSERVKGAADEAPGGTTTTTTTPATAEGFAIELGGGERAEYAIRSDE